MLTCVAGFCVLFPRGSRLHDCNVREEESRAPHMPGRRRVIPVQTLLRLNNGDGRRILGSTVQTSRLSPNTIEPPESLSAKHACSILGAGWNVRRNHTNVIYKIPKTMSANDTVPRLRRDIERFRDEVNLHHVCLCRVKHRRTDLCTAATFTVGPPCHRPGR